jgi:hypothetical protein
MRRVEKVDGGVNVDHGYDHVQRHLVMKEVFTDDIYEIGIGGIRGTPDGLMQMEDVELMPDS